MNIIKGGLLTLIVVAIISGSVYMLMVMDIIPAPALLQKLPVVGERLVPENKVLLTAEEKLQEKSAQLEKDLTQRDEEIEELQSQLEEADKEIKRVATLNQELQSENESLKQQIEDLQTGRANQQAAYKDMANYFTEMKAQEAADLIFRQRDQDIIGILSEMETSKAADILEKMDRDKAAAITRQMLAVSP
jgi:flagellar motility protein MotE (MotC chaperone)